MFIIRLIGFFSLMVVLTLAGVACGQPSEVPGETQKPDGEIRPAPIDEVKVNLLKSNPAQVAVYIKGGLPDGCTTFHDIETTRDGNTVNIKVTVQRPRDVSCPAVYTNFEQYVNLGTDFAISTVYTLNVNDYTTMFAY